MQWRVQTQEQVKVQVVVEGQPQVGVGFWVLKARQHAQVQGVVAGGGINTYSGVGAGSPVSALDARDGEISGSHV